MTIGFGFSLTGRGALADRGAITALAQRAEALGYDEIADGWHPLGLRSPVMLHPDELASRARRLRELATAAGRDPATIVIAFKAPFALREAQGHDRTRLTGSPAQLVEDLQAYVAAGARHFVLDFSVPTPPQMMEAMERFAAEVRPHVREV